MTKLAILLLVSLMTASCQDGTATATASLSNNSKVKESKVNGMTQEVSIKINEQAAEFQKRYADKVRIQKQPAGVDFYSIDWDSYPRGTVKIEHGKHSLVIENSLGIQTQIVMDLPSEGFFEYNIYVGLSESSPGLISHDEARLKTYALLKKIEQAGWMPLISEDDARITGKDRLNHVLNVTNSIGLDTKYIPTLEEWMRIENLTNWSFYADRQFLTVHFQRERTLLDPTKPGSYLLTYTLKSEVENYRGYVGSDNRARWKELLPAEIANLKQLRAKAEAALKAQGIAIDETYSDPPLPNLN